MLSTGIVAEYNPFHNGHKLHINKAKKLTQTENIIIIVLCAAGGQQQRSGQQKRGGSVPGPFFIIMRNHVKVTSTIIRYLPKALPIKKIHQTLSLIRSQKYK